MQNRRWRTSRSALPALLVIGGLTGCAPLDGAEADQRATLKDYDGGVGEVDDKAGPSTRYEAESRSAANACAPSTDHVGFTGTGFMDFGGNGSWIEWNAIQARLAGEYELSFRYASSNGNRSAAILVNGSSAGTVSFAPSGGWTNWKSERVKVRLRQGANTVRVQANSGNGGPNLDHVEVTASDCNASGSCGGQTSACTIVDERRSATLSCSGGATISAVQFASYGTPKGSCQTGLQTGPCHASSSADKVRAACVGKASCTVEAGNSTFGDPCLGTPKQLAVTYTCSAGGVDRCPNDPHKTEPGECGCGVPEGTCGGNAQISIPKVYLAQNHVLEADSPLFELVGSQEALIKVQVTGRTAVASPKVTATLTLPGRTTALTLSGPSTLPTSFASQPNAVKHRYEDSFTARIPRDWVRPGLSIAVSAGTARRDLGMLRVGAPTKVVMTMFDVHYFQRATGDYAAGWEQELEAKWPVSDLMVRRTRDIVFPQLIIPPRGGARAVKVSSKDDYKAQTGLNFDGEQAAALQWSGALKAAAGTNGRISLYYVNIYGVWAGGQAGGFGGVGNGTSLGILNHELGHSLSLPHWCGHASYPYVGNMYGIPADAADAPHVGPTWAFDLPSGKFLPPTVQPGATGGTPGQYKRDPMCGGGTGDQEQPFLMRHFSDYSVNQMRKYLQGHVVLWSSARNQYVTWNASAGDYTTEVSNDGVRFPVRRDASVISVMAAVSVSDAKAHPNLAHLVHPPIGPYTAGLIDLFDPNVAADRTRADQVFCPDSGCDFSLRVVQGGVTKTYMLPISQNPSADPTSGSSLQTRAINLPASGGQVTRAELLCTPDAEKGSPSANQPACPSNLASATWSR